MFDRITKYAVLLSLCCLFAAAGCGQDKAVDAEVFSAADDEPQEDAAAPAPKNEYAKGKIPSITPSSLVGFYYGDWNEDLIKDVTGKTGNKKYDLIVLHPKTNITKTFVDELRAGDIKVFCYLSVGEDDTLHTSAATGGISGPAQGHATWYYDSAGNDSPDKNSTWGSYFVNAGDKNWHAALKNYRNADGEGWYGYDYLMNDLGCDGLFLDTVDTYSPNSWGLSYGSEMDEMIELLQDIRNNIPFDRYIMMNRGLFYFDPAGLDEVTEEMRDRVRGLVNAVVYESFMIDPLSQRDYWAARLNENRDLEDGFNVIALDYLPDPAAATDEEVAGICNEVKDVRGWISVISSNPLYKNFWHTSRDRCL